MNLGVEWNLIVLNSSHTHSGPYMIRQPHGRRWAARRSRFDYFKT